MRLPFVMLDVRTQAQTKAIYTTGISHDLILPWNEFLENDCNAELYSLSFSGQRTL